MNIKEARKKLRLTQGQLADLCGISQGHLCEIEAGRAQPKNYVRVILRACVLAPDIIDELLKEAVNEADT